MGERGGKALARALMFFPSFLFQHVVGVDPTPCGAPGRELAGAERPRPGRKLDQAGLRRL